MDGRRFDALARIAGTRRGLLGLAGLWAGAAGLGLGAASDAKNRHRRRRRDNDKPKRKRNYPVFTTCYTDEGDVGKIPDGPHPTCRSVFDPDEFTPCNPELTLDDLKAKCDETYPECNGDCRIKARPMVGLGDCPDFTVCVVTNGSQPPIPGGPYGSCWSWPDGKCETCSGAKYDYQGLKDLCGRAYPAGQDVTCWNRFGVNLCYPWGCNIC